MALKSPRQRKAALLWSACANMVITAIMMCTTLAALAQGNVLTAFLGAVGSVLCVRHTTDILKEAAKLNG